MAPIVNCTVLVFAIKLKAELLFVGHALTVEDICRMGELVVLFILFKSLDPGESKVLIPEQTDEKAKAPIS